MDYSLPGPSVHGIIQARIVEWVAVPSSGGSSQSRDQTQVSLIAGRFFKPMHFEKDLREPGLDEGRLGWKSVCVKDKVLDQDKVS